MPVDFFGVKKQQLVPVLGLAPLVPVVAMGGLPWGVLPAWGVLVLIGVVLGEWQRRRTLLAILRQAPPGSVVEQEPGIGGPGMRIRVGSPVPPARRRR
ncbi:hypothetical protein [Streptomyces sp. NPDC051921]|uniref:hypothetical protein n=1 Tax=Streptomyces sp. NPDC051921 TaxID=3155806 RepID=UPI00341AA502